MKTNLYLLALTIIILSISFGCSQRTEYPDVFPKTTIPGNMLNFQGTPFNAQDRSSLLFSDQGAWFGYSFPANQKHLTAFSGPFLMTHDNGSWCSKALCLLKLTDGTNEVIDLKPLSSEKHAYNSHLQQTFENDSLKLEQILFYPSAHSALIVNRIQNKSKNEIVLRPSISGVLMDSCLSLKNLRGIIEVNISKSKAKGFIQFHFDFDELQLTDSSYKVDWGYQKLKPQEYKEIIISQSFIFPEYSTDNELKKVRETAKDYKNALAKVIAEKEVQLKQLYAKLGESFLLETYKDLVAKLLLTLQNNWRVPAGELKHAGLFPSYHYIWFHGFWAWDSWKHAVALAHINPGLAKDQVRAMYDYQMDNGFIIDCIYRDTSLEKHNYRNSKPPLSAWAVWQIYEEDKDTIFLHELFPKIMKQHDWWYKFRDIDKDSLCEYGSTDGTLIAAKWESGMDNAVRFDDSRILQMSSSAFSLDQESVDLNAYLYAEKLYLAKIALVVNDNISASKLERDAALLQKKIQTQFFDSETGWFYDCSIDGTKLIETMGCEGWIPLWANAATKKQALAVKENIMDTSLFNTKVPLQTLAANHPLFKPNRGYWRGPNWLDQSYFGIKGLQNYGHMSEAKELTHKLIHNAEGVLEKGASIRENYNPITGEGMEAHNFSWSAAHYLLLLINQ